MLSGGLEDDAVKAVAKTALDAIPAFPPWMASDGNAPRWMPGSAVAIYAAAPPASKATARSGVIPPNPRTPPIFMPNDHPPWSSYLRLFLACSL
jgi:hypothetical protein